MNSIKKCIVKGVYRGFNCSPELETIIRRMTAKQQSERLRVE